MISDRLYAAVPLTWGSVRSLLLFLPLAFAVGEPLVAQSPTSALDLAQVLEIAKERNARLRALRAAAEATAYREAWLDRQNRAAPEPGFSDRRHDRSPAEQRDADSPHRRAELSPRRRDETPDTVGLPECPSFVR